MDQTKRSVSRKIRLKVANQIIEAIASCGRRFLSTNSDARPHQISPTPRFSRFELVNGRLWYVDKYRESRIFVHYDPRARSGWGWRFSDGGTLLSICRMLRDFILKGTAINPAWFAVEYWGYEADGPVLRAKVEAVLAQWEKDQKYCCASCGGDREVDDRGPEGGSHYARCAVCGCIAIKQRESRVLES